MLTQFLEKTTAAPAAKGTWFHVSVGGDETITYPDGTHGTEFVVDGFKVEVEDSYLGLADREQILAAAAEIAPDKAVLDFWQCKAPANEF
jgi:hypothetical protein